MEAPAPLKQVARQPCPRKLPDTLGHCRVAPGTPCPLHPSTRTQHPYPNITAHTCPQMVYFVRDPSKFVTRENVGSVIFFGVMRGGDPLHSLLNIMHGLYVPVVVANTTWPETVKSDFTAQMHKFMANLTETVYEVKGKTILYIPQVRAGYESLGRTSRGAWMGHSGLLLCASFNLVPAVRASHHLDLVPPAPLRLVLHPSLASVAMP